MRVVPPAMRRQLGEGANSSILQRLVAFFGYGGAVGIAADSLLRLQSLQQEVGKVCAVGIVRQSHACLVPCARVCDDAQIAPSLSFACITHLLRLDAPTLDVSCLRHFVRRWMLQ